MFTFLKKFFQKGESMNSKNSFQNKLEVKQHVKECNKLLRKFKKYRKPSNFNLQDYNDTLTEIKNKNLIQEKYYNSLIKTTDYLNNEKTPITYAQHSYWASVDISHNIRLLHIAYSMWRGKTYDQVEKPKDKNSLTDVQWKKINMYISSFPEKPIKDVITQ